jgi:signal-transduction protein with cAMP-binding, CBS, and nucleotidyltransferase domain
MEKTSFMTFYAEILKWLNNRTGEDMKVQELMKTKIASVDADSSVYDAVEKIVDRRIRSLLVKFPGKDLNHGIITARDIVFKVLAKRLNPKDIKVSEIAAKPIACFDKDAEKIIGVISLTDIMAGALIMRARGDHDF